MIMFHLESLKSKMILGGPSDVFLDPLYIPSKDEKLGIHFSNIHLSRSLSSLTLVMVFLKFKYETWVFYSLLKILENLCSKMHIAMHTFSFF